MTRHGGPSASPTSNASLTRKQGLPLQNWDTPSPANRDVSNVVAERTAVGAGCQRASFLMA
jgi:hypothetical protein